MKRYTFKKICAAAVAAVTLFTFSACSGGGSSEDGGSPNSGAEAQGTSEASGASAVNDEIRDIPSTEFVKEIKIGWNLGNTLDAEGTSGLESETSWGNVLTTKEVFTKLKESGFNTVRIPVTWKDHMDENNVVDEAWMNRVQEVVDYAYSQDMYVILNAHHEGWYDPYYDNLEAASAKLAALWEQIGNHFEGYSERLIFEGMNEPRKRNTPLEWNGGDDEGRDVVNQFNDVFVKTIRGLGGNNPKRHLMIPGYAASSSENVLKAIKLPEGDDKIIVSVHAYLPYTFALSEDLTARDFSPEGSSANEVLGFMNTLKTNFIDKNVPVIIGEMGARSKANEEIRAEWAEFYVSHAKEIGVPCVWWDNGAFSGNGECFGLLDRSSCAWKYPLVVDGLMKGLNEE